MPYFNKKSRVKTNFLVKKSGIKKVIMCVNSSFEFKKLLFLLKKIKKMSKNRKNYVLRRPCIEYLTRSLSWEEFRDIAKKLTYRKGNRKQFGCLLPPPSLLVYQNGGKVFSNLSIQSWNWICQFA